MAESIVETLHSTKPHVLIQCVNAEDRGEHIRALWWGTGWSAQIMASASSP